MTTTPAKPVRLRGRMIALAGCAGIAIAGGLPAAGVGAVGDITEYALPGGQTGPGGLNVASDGRIWMGTAEGLVAFDPDTHLFSSYAVAGVSGMGPIHSVVGSGGLVWFVRNHNLGASIVGKMNTDGTGLTTYAVLPTGASPQSLIDTGDGYLWTAERGVHSVARFDKATQAVVECDIGAGKQVDSVALGSDGNVWVATENNQLVRLSRTCSGISGRSYFSVAGSHYAITSGPDGDLWTNRYGAGVAKTTTAGVPTLYANTSMLPTGGSSQIAFGDDGNLWATSNWTSPSPVIIRTTTAGVATSFTVPSASPNAYDLIRGSGGLMWFTENGANKIASIVAAAAPGAPTALGATAGNGEATLSWTAPASDGGSAITSYTATDGNGHTCTANTGNPVTPSCTVTGLGNGIGYTFTVSATNGIGTGAASSGAAVTPFTVPGAPIAPAGVAGDGQATLTWTAPASDGGSAITSYTVTDGNGHTCTSTAGSPVAPGCTVTGLTNGTAYAFTVSARNAAGSGAAASVSPVTPVAPVVPAPEAGGAAAGGATPSVGSLRVGRISTSTGARSVTVATRAAVAGPGRLLLTVTPLSAAAETALPWARAMGASSCTDSATARAAGAYTVSCALGAGVRAEVATRAVRVRVAVTFTPLAGAATTRTRIVRVARVGSARTAVTG